MRRRTYLAAASTTFTGVLAGCLDAPAGNQSHSHAGDMFGFSVSPIQPVNVGIVGLGNRGSKLTRLVHSLTPEKATLTAICDLRPERVMKMESWLTKRGQAPDTYTGDVDSWQEMVARDDLDLVIVATPYQKHAKMAMYAMERGNHVAVEVPAARTLEDCHALVRTAERERRHCMMLENVTYFDTEMWVLNMVEQGVFGSLNYARGGYVHNLIERFFFKAYWNNWRARAHLNDVGDLYPTHGLGPIAQYMDILQGDRFVSLVSRDSPETRMTERAAELPPDHEFHGKTDWANGDTTTTLIETAAGKTIELQFDVKTNRQYTRYNHVQGTDAFHAGFPSRLAVDSEGGHGFLDEETYQQYRDQYRHPLWESLGDLASEYGGHGGGDWLMLYRLFDALNKGRPLDMTVYDAATWSAVIPLSGESIRQDEPVEFPDFTGGTWEDDHGLPTMDSSMLP